MRRVLKAVLSWLAVALGFLLGIFALAIFGMEWIPTRVGMGWWVPWFTIVGIGLLGLGCTTSSIIATGSRRWAGFILLVLMPFAALGLAYPDSGYLRWDAHLGGVFETPIIPTAFWLTLLFFAPLFLLLLTIRHRKLAALLFAISACVAVVVFSMSRWTKVLVPHLAGWSAPFLVLACFWLGTHKRGWPPLVVRRKRSLTRHFATISIACLSVLLLEITVTLALTAWRSSLNGGDCSRRPLFSQQLSPEHSVFTARVIRVHHQRETSGKWAGDWAIGVVQERFWGIPRWGRLVLLTNYPFWEGETYFIDGRRAPGLLTRALPVVDAGTLCTRTRPVSEATVELRVLRQRKPSNGARIVGYVQRPQPFVAGFSPPVPSTPYVGAKIRVKGPMGTTIVQTDRAGVYELDNLPPGDYEVELLVPDSEAIGYFRTDEKPFKLHLHDRDLIGHNFEVFWNGRIEGHVRDDHGKPARVWIEVQSADGSQVPASYGRLLLSVRDGSYQIRKLPPGRYVVLVDPYGPEDERPYNIQYYPSAVRPQDAEVFQVGEGQEIKGVDFTVARLARRTVQARVTWPNGSPSTGASVCVTYVHTKGYESQDCTNFANTDKNGIARIHLYGNSRVRLFAQQLVDNDKTKWFDTYRSRPVESDASKVADDISLVLSSREEGHRPQPRHWPW
jgi:hypothetical protein